MGGPDNYNIADRYFHTRLSVVLVSLSLIVVNCFYCSKSLAANWSTEEYASLTSEYIDNFFLNSPGNEEVTTIELDLGGTLTRKTETGALRITPQFKLRKYKGDFESSSNDQYLYTSFQQASERSNVTFDLDYIIDTPLTSEAQGTEINESDNRRDKGIVKTLWVYQLTESFSSIVNLGYNNVEHENSPVDGLVDYDYQSGSAGLSKALSEATKLSIIIFGSRYKAPDVLNETDDVGVDLRWESVLEGKSTLSVNYSWHESTVKIGPQGTLFRETRQGRLLNAKFSKKFEKGNVLVTVENQLNPSSGGIVEQHDKYQLIVSRNITEKSYIWIGFLNTYVKDITNREEFIDWEYRQYTIQWSYRLLPDWFLRGTFQYAWKKLENDDNYNDSNALFLSIQYVSS